MNFPVRGKTNVWSNPFSADRANHALAYSLERGGHEAVVPKHSQNEWMRKREFGGSQSHHETARPSHVVAFPLRAALRSACCKVVHKRGTLGMRILTFFAAIFVSMSCAMAEPAFKTVEIDNGITLHYVEAGSGPPVIFVHGSLSDAGYWSGQMDAFAAAHYHVIAYSRRYNWPNKNAPIDGYSAIVDAQDLAALIETLHLGKAYVVGLSYGAYTALFLSARRPDLVRAAVLSEPPAMTLLQHIAGRDAALGEKTFADVEENMVRPMTIDFRVGQSEKGVAPSSIMFSAIRKPGRDFRKPTAKTP